MKLFTARFLYGFMGLYVVLAILLLYGIGSNAELHLFPDSVSYSGFTSYSLFTLFHLGIPVLAFIYLKDKYIRERNGN